MQTLKDDTLWPLKIGVVPVDVNLAKNALRKSDYLLFLQKRMEVESKKKMYCQNPRCSKFICLDFTNETVVECE